MEYRIVVGGNRSGITTESPFDRTVKWLSVYIVGILGLFLLIKEHVLDDAVECQPINRGIRENLSYSQAQATYDKAYCSSSMLDYTQNLIRAQADTLNTVPGVSILGIKGHPKTIYQRYFPFALLIQAVISYCPVLLWKLWSTEVLVTAIKYVGVACKDIIKKDPIDTRMESTPKISPRSTPMEAQQRIGELDRQIELWLDQKYLSRLYVTKLVLTEIVLIFMLSVYFTCPSLFISNFKFQFVCRVDDQVLVSCAMPLVNLYKLAWYLNIAILDVCILFTIFQFLNILCCMQSRRNFFFFAYIGIGPSLHPSAITDAHLISYFCHHNLSAMPPDILASPTMHADVSRAPSTLICFGETEDELSDSGTMSFHTASNEPFLKGPEKRKYKQ